MKKTMAVLLLVWMLLCSCAHAQEAATIAGSDGKALMAALAEFGIEIPEHRRVVEGWSWEVDDATVADVDCGYEIVTTLSGGIIRATFTMDGKDNGLFAAVASGLTYDAAKPEVAKSFVASGLGKDVSLTIGDACFTLENHTSVSTVSISIGGWTRSSTSESTEYVLRVEYTDAANEVTTIARTTTQVNVRAEDNAESTRLGRTEEGEEFVVLQAYYSPKWHQILYNGEIGYISANYCELITQEPETK